jgi:hypothetical protein
LYVSDLSPQESTLLCDVVEVGQLPNFVPEDEKTRYAFYLLTRQGLKFECSSTSEIQVRESYSEMQKIIRATEADLHWIWSFSRLIHGKEHCQVTANCGMVLVMIRRRRLVAK